MRIEFLDGEIASRVVGAAVVRSDPGGLLLIDLGPADGPAITRLRLSVGEANQLAAALKSVSNGKDEEVILTES